MKDYLNVILLQGDKEIQIQGIAVPRQGDWVHLRNEGGDLIMGGHVAEVVWTYRTTGPGVVVTVSLLEE